MSDRETPTHDTDIGPTTAEPVLATTRAQFRHLPTDNEEMSGEEVPLLSIASASRESPGLVQDAPDDDKVDLGYPLEPFNLRREREVLHRVYSGLSISPELTGLTAHISLGRLHRAAAAAQPQRPHSAP
jgi:hypothetical protein